MAPSSWLEPLSAPRPAAPRLLIFPHAGAGSWPYRPLALRWGEAWEPWALVLPGREHRSKEAPVARWAELLPLVQAQLQAWAQPGRPYLLWGHSLGAALASTLLLGPEPPAPAALALSGCAAPGHRRWAPLADDSDEALRERLRALGGTPEELLQGQLFELMAPTWRADLNLAAQALLPPEGQLPGPTLILGGAEDALAPPASLLPWRGRCAGPVQLAFCPGGHFFPFSPPGRDWLGAQLQAWWAQHGA